jgi:hypothetical protein
MVFRTLSMKRGQPAYVRHQAGVFLIRGAVPASVPSDHMHTSQRTELDHRFKLTQQRRGGILDPPVLTNPTLDITQRQR